MKKYYSVIFILLSLIILFSGVFKAKYVSADEVFKSKAVYLIDFETGTPIYSKDEEKHLPIASMCKIMTLLLCFEELDNNTISFDDIISVSENASSMGGSQIFLEKNASYKVSDLIKGIVVASANDACVAMAEHISGSEELFVKKMNEKSSQLGMCNTVFTNCTGLPKPGQYSCAKDVSKMFRELLNYKSYFNFSKIWTDTISHPNDRVTEITNTNKLIKFYGGCDGGKTGYTAEAGHCICSSAIRDNLRLISVVIGAPDSKSRFKECSDMFNFGFANYCMKMVVDNTKPLDFDINVDGGKVDKINVSPNESFYVLSKKNEKRSFEFEYELKNKVTAPLLKGDKVGDMIIYENGVEIKSVSIVANDDVKKAGFFDNVNKIASDFSIISK